MASIAFGAAIVKGATTVKVATTVMASTAVKTTAAAAVAGIGGAAAPIALGAVIGGVIYYALNKEEESNVEEKPKPPEEKPKPPEEKPKPPEKGKVVIDTSVIESGIETIRQLANENIPGFIDKVWPNHPKIIFDSKPTSSQKL